MMNENELKENNFQNLLKWQQQLTGLKVNGNGPQAALTIDELFEFLEKNFDAYHESAILKAVLPIVHNSVRLYARKDFANHDIGLILLCFYETHNENEADLLIFVQILHQVLHTLYMFHHKEIIFSQKVFTQLIKKLPMLSGRVIVSNIIACLVLHKNHSSEMEHIQMLWSDLSQRLKINTPASKTCIDILVQLFDEFISMNPNLCNDPILVTTIQILLKSNVRDERKCGYFLFKKLISCFIDNLKNASVMFLSQNHPATLQNTLSCYITILENLEENQSHLILPSLSNLKEIIKSKQLEPEWLEILYFRILSHNNILVLRWSIEFFLENFTCPMLSLDNLKHLLSGLNSTVLYNFEGYFLEDKYFTSFLQGDLCNLYMQMGEINWKPVPLYHLFTQLRKCPLPQSIPFEQVLKISSRVRNITVKRLRENSARIFNIHIEAVLEKMKIEEYVKYIENLFTPGDCNDVWNWLRKKQDQLDETKHENIFQKRFFEIAVRASRADTERIILFLEQTPIKCHGWLRFVPFHQGILSDFNMQRLYDLYSIVMDPKKKTAIPQTAIDRFKNFQNKIPSKEELEQVNTLLTVISIYKLDTLDGLSEDRFSEILLDSLDSYAVKHLCECLDRSTEVFASWIINRLIDLCSSDDIFTRREKCEYIQKYLVKKNILCNHIEKILEKSSKCSANILDYISSSVIFNSNIKKGESRIEECYVYNKAEFLNFKILKYIKICDWIDQVTLHGDFKYRQYLLKCHDDVTKRKQRYFANSYEHRVKMRIALGLAALWHRLQDTDMYDKLWSILLYENNQLNITYMYEYLLSLCETRWNLLLEKLDEAHNLTSSQQISIMSVVYNTVMRRATRTAKQQYDIVKHFLALTMGAHFYTRLFAQLALINLYKNEKLSEVTFIHQLINSIDAATNQKVNDHNLDFRLFLYSLRVSPLEVWQVILYVTNAPYDELFFDETYHYVKSFEEYRDYFCKKMEAKINSDAVSFKASCSTQLQRKMNPLMDIIEPSNLFKYPLEETSAEMFVITSLIDKLPNLGGIARTCEVLGICNIVLNSKRDIEKNDFKNLSMTAEKSLNLIEVKQNDLGNFIINKQKEGFSVVGAEQTSTSQSFVGFKFPPKCLLLLGHEKDGIPPTLLGLLDYAVEIPQFGQVRSLNVHVTGALFMWEYCKQHLIK